MRRFLAVIVREIAARTNVLAVGAAVAVMPWLVALAPLRGDDRADATRATALVLGAAFGIAMSAALGATMIASDASARRLSFYLSKPLPIATLWFGKLFANSVVVAAVTAAIAWRGVADEPWVLLALLIIPLLLAIAHVVSMFVRANGAGSVVLIAGVTIAGPGAAAELGYFVLRDAFVVSRVMVVWWIAALIAAVLIAGVWQLREGAWDVRAGSRALLRAIAKWLVIGGASASAAHAAWIVFGTPFHGPILIAVARSGVWAEIVTADPLRLDYFRAGMLNVATGERVALPVPVRLQGAFFGSDRGGDFFAERGLDGLLVHLKRGWRITMRKLPCSGTVIAASADGARIAVIDDARLTLFDVAARRPCWSAAAHEPSFVAFDARAGARLVYHDSALRIVQLDSACRAISSWSVPLTWADDIADVRDDGAVLTTSAVDWQLFDAHAHRVRRGGATRHTWMGFIDDGRILHIEEDAPRGATTMTVMSRDGAPQRAMVFPWADDYPLTTFGGSFVVIRVREKNVLIDLSRGIARDLRGMDPVAWGPRTRLARGAAAAVFNRAGGGLVRLDPVTGRTTVIYDAPPPHTWQRSLLFDRSY